MFSTGQIYFAIFFVLTFIAAMIWSYRKDIKRHQLHYKNVALKVLIAGVIVVASFILIRIYLK